jgi:hypothetical protein
MSDFVEQCRGEWKRLGVPDSVAEEMAADLASDLRDAESEGVSAEELLGDSVFDPRSFAASWAAERGVIPAPSGRGTGRRRPIVLVAFTALAAFTVIITALLLATGEPKLTLAASRSTPFGTTRSVVHSVSAAAPIEWILLFLAVVALGFAAWLWAGWSRSRAPGVPA